MLFFLTFTAVFERNSLKFLWTSRDLNKTIPRSPGVKHFMISPYMDWTHQIRRNISMNWISDTLPSTTVTTNSWEAFPYIQSSDLDVIWTHNLLIWSQTRYHCATRPHNKATSICLSPCLATMGTFSNIFNELMLTWTHVLVISSGERSWVPTLI